MELTAAFLTVVLLIFSLASGTIFTKSSRRVVMANSRFDASWQHETVTVAYQNGIMANYDSTRRPWCTIYCRNDEYTFTFWNTNGFLIVDSYVNEGPVGADYSECWIPLPISILAAAGVSISASGQVWSQYSDRVPLNLIDGIYGYGMKECFASENIGGAFVVVDLGAMYKLIKIYMRAQNKGNFYLFDDIDIRVGIVPLPGPDFSTYKLLSRSGPTPYIDYVHTVVVSPPLIARYIAVQKTIGDRIQMCHMGVEALLEP